MNKRDLLSDLLEDGINADDYLQEGIFDIFDKDKMAKNKAVSQQAKANTQAEKDAMAKARKEGGKVDVTYGSEDAAGTNAQVDSISADFQRDVNKLWTTYLKRLGKNFGDNFEKAPQGVQNAIGVISKSMKDLGANLEKVKGGEALNKPSTTTEVPDTKDYDAQNKKDLDKLASYGTKPATPTTSTETPMAKDKALNKDVADSLRKLKFKNDEVSRMMNFDDVKNAKTVEDKIKVALTHTGR